MNSSNKVWFPRTGDLSETQRAALMVPYSGDRRTMNLSLLKDLLSARLSAEVKADPLSARSALEMSAEQAPELLEIAQKGQPKDWPSQIVESDGMARLLAQIDWQQESKGGMPIKHPDPASLQETLELLA